MEFFEENRPNSAFPFWEILDPPRPNVERILNKMYPNGFSFYDKPNPDGPNAVSKLQYQSREL